MDDDLDGLEDLEDDLEDEHAASTFLDDAAEEDDEHPECAVVGCHAAVGRFDTPLRHLHHQERRVRGRTATVSHTHTRSHTPKKSLRP